MFTFAIAKKTKKTMENEQIDIILQNEGLNASQLAERLNMQRAQISHLQNNRNRVSLDVVKKIHHAFPHIRLEWLIDREGDYWNPDVTPVTTLLEAAVPTASSAHSGMGDLFGEDEISGYTKNDVSNSREPAESHTEIPQTTAENAHMSAENPKNPTKDTGTADFLKENGEKSPIFAPKETGNLSIHTPNNPARKIVELKIFYNDGTYETFVERKREP